MQRKKLLKIAKATNGTIFQHLGTTKAYGKKFANGRSVKILKHENRKLGRMGAASPCYRIDPETGEKTLI